MAYKSGEKLCGCTLLEKCGAGAYGEVWLAEDVLGARVAVKIIGACGRCSERELAGLKNYRDCNHPNLLKIRFVEITESRIACVMDAADDLNGGKGPYLPDTLTNRLERAGRLESKEILAMLEGLLAGLEELHRNGLVHRDIKPDNILWVNGRPTLADAGLIALEGKGSLVGTPGFMSPKLLAGRGAADASDDFYALGKVIYCALTGLPVGEYPSIPENMTISVDAVLGRAFREACKQPVRTSEEFRSLLSGAALPDRRRALTRKVWLFAGGAAALLLLSAAFLLTLPKKAETLRYVNSLPPDSPEALEIDRQLAEAKKKLAESQKKMQEDFDRFNSRKSRNLNEMQRDAAALFRRRGLLPGDGKFTARLLDYEILTQDRILGLLMRDTRNPRLRPTDEALPPGADGLHSKSAQGLYGMFLSSAYGDFDGGAVEVRRAFWRGRSGTAEEIQRQMLETDPLMQALALDLLIREKANAVIEAGAFRPGDKKELGGLFRLRRGLLDSEPMAFPDSLFAESSPTI